MTAPQLAPGQVVAGKYSILSLLGFGGAIATYRALLAPNRDVVVKLYSPAVGGRSDVLGALEQAVAVTNALPAEWTAPILESGFDQGTRAPFTVTDLVTAPSLARTVLAGPMPVPEVIEMLRGVGRVVDAAHAQRLAHGALKPQNIFVGGAGPQRTVRVVDFGVRLARGVVPTQEGFAIAAPWMAPEQLQPGVDGPAVDVFAAALVAFFAATGRSYWRSCQAQVPDLAALQAELLAPRPSCSSRARELGATLPATLDAALNRAISVNPAERFGSVTELADALAARGSGPNLHMTMPLDAMSFAQVMAPPAAPAPPPAAKPLPFAGTMVLGANAPRSPDLGLPSFSIEDSSESEPATAVMASPLDAFSSSGSSPAAVLPQAGHAPPAYAQPAIHAPSPSVAPRPEEATVMLPRKKTALWIWIAIAFVIVAGGATAAILLATRGGGAPVASNTPTGTGASSSPATTATPPPTGSTQEPAVAVAPTGEHDAAAAPVDAGAEHADHRDAEAAEAHDAESAPPAELTITCKPACETIKIDGVALDGEQTDAIQLAAGTHTLTLGKPSYVTQTKKVTLKAGQKEAVTVLLFKPGPAVAPRPCGKFLERCP